tara:strand:+ start:14667 stop:15902 length:1236 start_codon:yes stop_codon:yes gene_type:complete
MDIRSILHEAVRQKASDVHLKYGSPPMLRVNGKLIPLHAKAQALGRSELKSICSQLLDERSKKKLIDNKEVDIAYSIDKVGRFRANIFQQRGTYAVVIRNIPFKIPALKSLQLPSVIEKLTDLDRGLILFTGETGSGKSTSLAAFVDSINHKYYKHIITIEDPIEYLIPDDKSIITQREVGVDTINFSEALRASLRQDPDVILIGELRDQETVKTALMAAETGHLVISTLHTTDTRDSILRILSYFEPHQQQQIQLQLAASLKAVISQRLLKRKDEQGFVPAAEVLVNSPRVTEAILDLQKLLDIKEVLEEGHLTYGMQSFEQCLMSLLRRDLVTRDEARKAASTTSDFDLKMQGIFSISRSDHPDDDFHLNADTETTMKHPKNELQLETVVRNRSSFLGLKGKAKKKKKA